MEGISKMPNSVTHASNAVPATAGRNVFASYGESAGGSNFIVGELMKYSKGDYLVGQFNRHLADGTKLIAAMDTLQVGFQKWEAQRPIAYRIGLLVDGFVPPKRDELGDLDERLVGGGRERPARSMATDQLSAARRPANSRPGDDVHQLLE